MAIRRTAKELKSVFSVLADDENSASSAFGWCLDRSPTFRSAILTEAMPGSSHDAEEALVDLQASGASGGFTDIELRLPSGLHLIFEAKVGWQLASEEQFARYARRFEGSRDQAALVSISAASTEYAIRNLPETIEGYPVAHLSWSKIRALAATSAQSTRSLQEKFWLRELRGKLEGFAMSRDIHSNQVYVVSVSTDTIIPDEKYTWIDVIERDNRYFHPVGTGWPYSPPTYIGFRYHGRLQGVHFIEHYDVVRNLRNANPNWGETNSDYFVYTLGPRMLPPREMRTGRGIYRNARVNCAIDTLLSGQFDTITEARNETKRREADS